MPELRQTLVGHWLTGLGCSHDEDAPYNRASCWCGWTGPKMPNVGQAVETWASHVCEEVSR